MADDKKTKKKGKKVVFILGALLALALIITLIVVLSPKDKTSQESLNEVASISMVDNEDSKANYSRFASEVSSTAGVSYYSTEISLISKLTYTIDEVIDFYNEYYPLAQNIGAYAGTINNSLVIIKNNEKQLGQILAELKAHNTNGLSHLQNIWVDYRATYSQQLDAYQTLFGVLNKMYHNCLGNSMAVNDASKLVLNTIDDYMKVITKIVDEIVSTDVKGSKQADYSIGTLAAKVDAFDMFTSKYLVQNGRNFIQQYHSSSSVVYSTLNAFNQKFAEDNYEKVIESIEYSSSTLVVKYSNEKVTASDSEALASLNIVKRFVKGGL